MKVLVTGPGGFIGRHLVDRLLADGWTVRALVRVGSDWAQWMGKVEIIEGDVQNLVAMKGATCGVETVFHLAGKAHTLIESQQDDTAYHPVNVEGTRNVLEGAVAGGVRRFVFFSSIKAVGDESSRCLDENCQSLPRTLYGRSKLAAEQLVLEYGQRSELHVVCLRLPLVYGPGVKGNLARMISGIDRGLFPPLPMVDNRRSMVHVSDVVEAALLAAKNPLANGQCYNVTDGKPLSTRETYEMIALALGKRIPRWCVPVWVFKGMGLIGDAIGRVRGKRFLFDSEVLEKLMGSAWFSSEKITRELGYRPSLSFEEALPELIAWYRTSQA